MSRLPALLELAAFTQAAEDEFIAGLTPDERQAVGASDDWAAKDLVAHVTTWRERGAQELKEADLGPLPPEGKEFDAINRAIFDKNHSLSWEVVRRKAKESWAVYSSALRELNEDLLATSPGPGQSDRPLWRRITVDAGNHPVLHYAEFARRGGRAADATHWIEGVCPLLLAVDTAGEWQGVVHYNLACHYAQVGMPDKALDSLRASLKLNPGLAQWSKQDADLAPLHQDPQFLGLFEV